MGLEMWTLYHSPTDAPGLYVLRRFEGEGPTDDVHHSVTVEPLRKLMRDKGLHFIGRMPGDEPQIVGVYL